MDPVSGPNRFDPDRPLSGSAIESTERVSAGGPPHDVVTIPQWRDLCQL
jgi:hypothetical protein